MLEAARPSARPGSVAHIAAPTLQQATGSETTGAQQEAGGRRHRLQAEEPENQPRNNSLSVCPILLCQPQLLFPQSCSPLNFSTEPLGTSLISTKPPSSTWLRATQCFCERPSIRVHICLILALVHEFLQVRDCACGFLSQTAPQTALQPAPASHSGGFRLTLLE